MGIVTLALTAIAVPLAFADSGNNIPITTPDKTGGDKDKQETPTDQYANYLSFQKDYQDGKITLEPNEKIEFATIFDIDNTKAITVYDTDTDCVSIDNETLSLTAIAVGNATVSLTARMYGGISRTLSLTVFVEDGENTPAQPTQTATKIEAILNDDDLYQIFFTDTNGVKSICVKSQFTLITLFGNATVKWTVADGCFTVNGFGTLKGYFTADSVTVEFCLIISGDVCTLTV